MPADMPPPVVIPAQVVPTRVADAGSVYGPIDTETHPELDGDCPPPIGNEIVVCAKVDNEQYRIVHTPPPPTPTASDKLNEALNLKIGDLEIGSIDRGDGTRAFGLRLKF